jgi:hypothetical protein
MKSVPNLIFYLHEFFWIFSQFLAIYFELFSSGVIFNSKIADEWAPPVRRRAPRRARVAMRRCHVAATRRAARACLKAAVGTARRASRQSRPRARPPRARAAASPTPPLS